MCENSTEFTPPTYFSGKCVGFAWTFGDSRCPNETGEEWVHRNPVGTPIRADEGLLVKCIKEAGTHI